LAGVFFAALPFRHPPHLAGVFFAALPFRHPPLFFLAGVFHRRAAIILASSRLARVFPSPRCHHLVILSFGRHLPSPHCHHLGILSFGRRLPSPHCHHLGILSFGQRLSIAALPSSWHPLVWPASSIAALPYWHPLVWPVSSIAALPFRHPCLAGVFPSPRYHLSILVWPVSSIAAPPQTVPSIAAPPSLISAGSFNRRATFSHLGRLIHLSCHYLLSRPVHFNWLAHLTAAFPYLFFRRLPLQRRPFMAVQPIDCHVM
jgi:hypothetical protein